MIDLEEFYNMFFVLLKLSDKNSIYINRCKNDGLKFKGFDKIK